MAGDAVGGGIRGRITSLGCWWHELLSTRQLKPVPGFLALCGPAGMQHSTAEVEHELLQLWSNVEKDRDAAAARRQAHAQRRRRRAEAARTKLAPISSSPVGLGSSRAGAGSSGDGKGSWQRLWPGEEEGEEGRAAAVRHAPAGDDMPAGEAGVAAAATEAGGFAASERRSLLPGGGGSEQEAAGSPLAVPPHLPRIRTSSAASLQLLEQQGQQGQQQAGQQPLQPLEQAQQPQQAQQQRAQHEVELQSSIGAGRSAATAAWPSSREAPHDVEAGAAAEQDEDEQEEAGESTYLAGEWGTGSRTASQQLERLASGLRQQRSLNGQQLEQLAEEGGTAGQQQAAAAGAGAVSLQEGAAAAAAGAGKEPSFWSTLREMLLDIRLVASGPERQALQVGGRSGGCDIVLQSACWMSAQLRSCSAHRSCLLGVEPAPPADGAVAGVFQPSLCEHKHHQLRPCGALLGSGMDRNGCKPQPLNAPVHLSAATV